MDYVGGVVVVLDVGLVWVGVLFVLDLFGGG